ncbi:pregnancy zone protein-like [Eriocheir sinensis]|uniref:pregnancy zone protein-like n=1 Tax=Eriocheir sinensis TaxID=95602 RepID=UPI0021CA91E3|nr:pregnancy zone protein-like [Eriocheir sinensis]
MPFRFYLSATQHDGSRVPEWRLLRHRLLVSPEVRLVGGERRKLQARTVKMTHARYALWEAEIDVHVELAGEESPSSVESLWLEAELKDAAGGRSRTSLVTVAHHSPRGHHLQVTTSTRAPKVGEYVILHVRSNYYLDKFRYILLSKGMVIEAGQQTMEASLKTFPLPLTPEVAGVATVVVYTIGRDETLVADALTFPVDALTRKGLHVALRQDPRDAEKLKVTVLALPGSRVSLAGTHWESYSMQAGNDLTHAKVLYQMARDSSRVVQEPLEQRWVSQDGLPENILHLPRTSPGIDPNATFTYADLLVLSDGPVPTLGAVCGSGGASRGQCLLGGCYTAVERCDGKPDCLDRVDEKGCGIRGAEEENLAWYRQHRTSRLSRHYAPPWLWEEVVVGNTGTASLTVPIPPGPVHLALSAFSLHPEQGMTILPEPVQWEGSVGFWMSVEGPSRVGLYEQVGVRVTAVNHGLDRVSAVVVLANSADYKFVDVNAFQQPHTSQGRESRMVSGEHEHRVWVEAGEAHTLYLPIAPTRLGEVVVLVQASLPYRKLQKEVKMLVEPLGAVQEHHTSMLLDLSNRAYFFTFLDVNTSEGLVPGSDEAHVSVFGDTVGAVLLPSTPATPDKLLGLPTAGCEPVAFSFLLTVVQLRYWREMAQQPPLDEKQVFRQLSLLYQTLLVYQNRDGGFKYFRTSQRSSVWVTSLVLRALNEVSVTWPHLLYIDPQVTDKALRFVLAQQAPHGAWQEPSGEVGDRKLVPALYSLTGATTHALNLSTTAHTMIALHALKELPSPLDEQVLAAITRARGWLEDNLVLVEQASRPLEVSLVALALHLSSSKRAESAFEFLTRNARQEGPGVPDGVTAVKYVYWGEDLVPLPSYRVESQRPHLQPRRQHRHDAGNVAATAYALRLYSLRSELMTPSIMRWLQSQRSHDGGWMSTQDTLAAWEALYEYSRREGNARDTRLTVTVEPLHDHSQARTFFITPDNFLHLQTQQVDGHWGSVRVQGKGRGSAVLQLTSKYHVADLHHLTSPPTPAFRLMTRATWHGHNGSALTFATCVRWMFREGGDNSGVAVLEVTVPTGYGTSAEALRRLVVEGKVPNLRRADFTERRITFFFEKLTGSKTCVEFSVERWFPAANLTRVLPVKVYEYYSPELFEVELLEMSSVALDICQVCGSYQCPNCPVLSYYSSPAPPRPAPPPQWLWLTLGLLWAPFWLPLS